MNTYKKPTAEKISFTYENQVVADSSGGDCYTVTAYIHQTPEIGRGDYRIQVDAVHAAEHTTNGQNLFLSFNQPVTYKSSNGSCVGGDGTSTIEIRYTYWNNGTDNIGLGDVVVESAEGLAVTGARMECDGAKGF